MIIVYLIYVMDLKAAWIRYSSTKLIEIHRNDVCAGDQFVILDFRISSTKLDNIFSLFEANSKKHSDTVEPLLANTSAKWAPLY
jgi:trehalose-6-phosphatase